MIYAEADGLKLQIYVADVRDLVNEPLLRQRAHVAFWSPPYKKKDGYSLSLMEATGDLLGQALVPNSWAFMNFGQLKEDFGRPWEAATGIQIGGLTQHQTHIWLKSLAIDGTQRGHYQPLNSPNLLNYCYEFVFSYHTGTEVPPLDRLAVGCEFADKSNLTRGGRGKHGDVHCAGDVWWIPYRTTGAAKKKSHDYEFPVELPEYALKLSGAKPGQTVIDPFFGSGPTGLAGRKLGLNCIGIEIDKERANRAMERWLQK